MASSEPLRVRCRDGIEAIVAITPYLGIGGGMILFGKRILHPLNDADGMPNESGDLWGPSGLWCYDGHEHPFDIITPIVAAIDPQPSLRYAEHLRLPT